MLAVQPAVEAFIAGIARDGWAVTEPIITPGELDRLRAAVAPVAVAGRGGARNLLDIAEVRELAVSAPMRLLAEGVLGQSCFAVRGILFDKTPDANWKVIWHQDLTIPTTRRADVAGFGPWTEKESVAHVQPPSAVLERMLAIRVHLDPCGSENGPVRVISGSHLLGRLSPEAVDEQKTRSATDCLVEQGGVLAFRPLILHASSPSRVPSHRRVIHLEYAATELPSPLEWHRRIA